MTPKRFLELEEKLKTATEALLDVMAEFEREAARGKDVVVKAEGFIVHRLVLITALKEIETFTIYLFTNGSAI